MTTTPQTPTAYQKVAGSITELILSGELPPGQRLPTEAELAIDFDVSRSTIREALRVVSSQGLVATTRGVTGGSFVRHAEAGQVTDALQLGIGLLAATDRVTVDELLEVREVLEVPATRIAARRITPEMLRELETTIAEGSESSFDHHREFHIILLRAAGNRLLEVMTRPIFEVLRTRFLRDSAPAGFWNEVEHDHARIAAAMRDSDSDAAAGAMLAHLHSLRSTYVAIDKDRTP